MLQTTSRLIALFTLVVATATAFASHRPAASDLLPLVPRNAQVISGIADPGHGSTAGRLLAVTTNNNCDLADILALISPSPSSAAESRFRALIMVASSFTPGDLSQHLLLVSGHFDANRIRNAALSSGAHALTYSGLQLLAIPSVVLNGSRESEVRWIAVLHNQTVLVGTPALVTAAIDRWQQKQPADPALLLRLAQLPTDVNSWSLIALPPPALAAHLAFLRGHSPFAAALRNADEVELGVHYGPMTRIDFSIHQPSAIERMASPRRLPAASSVSIDELADQPRNPPGRVHGSVTVPGQKIDVWLSAWAQLRLETNQGGL
jgi:hypothetical protein